MDSSKFVGTIDNTITLLKSKEDKKEIKKIKQTVTMFQDAEGEEKSTLLNFVIPVGEEKKDFLTVQKDGDNYQVEINMPELFAGKEENFAGLKKVADGTKIVLNIDKTNSAITLNSKKENDEFEIVINSKDGEKYIISTSATKISLKYGDKDFSYGLPSEADKAIETQINKSVFEGILKNDEDSKIFNQPVDGKIENIPRYLFGMYFANIKGNKEIKLGDKTLYAINLSGEEGKTAYFASQIDKEGQKSVYMFNKGKFEKVSSFFFQNENKKGEKKVSLVIKRYKAPIYYDFECGKIEAGAGNKKVTLSDDAKEGIKILENLADDENNEFCYNEKIAKADGATHTLDGFSFKSSTADGRSYTKYKFAVVGDPKSLYEDSEKLVSEDEKSSAGDGSTDGASDTSKEEKEKTEGEEENEAKKDDGIITKEVGKKVDLRKPIEALGNSTAIVGAFLMVGALIPGVGLPLAMAGMSMFLAGTGASFFSNKFIFNPYEKKFRDYKKQKFVDHDYEDFFEEEDNLDNALEESKAVEKEFSKLTELPKEEGGNDVAKLLKEQIDKNGIALEYDELVLEKGAPELKSIVDDMKIVAKTKNDDEITVAFNNFVNNHFKETTPEDKEKLNTIFSNENKQDFVNFIKQADVLNGVHKKAEEIENKQKQTLMGFDDEKLSFIIGNKDLTKEKRKSFFERYGTTIVKNIALDEVNTEKSQKIFRFVKDNDEKIELMEILKDKADEFKINMEKIKTIAEEEKITAKNINDLKNYKEVTDELEAHKEKYNLTDASGNETNTSELVDKFLSSTTLVMFDNIAKNLNLDKLTEKESSTTPLANITNVMAGAVKEATYSNEIADKYKKIEEISKEMGLTQELNDFYFTKYLVRNADKNNKDFVKLINNDDKYKSYRNENNPDKPNIKLFKKDNAFVDYSVYPDFVTPSKDASLEITYPAVLARMAQIKLDKLNELEKNPEIETKIEKYQKIIDIYKETTSKNNFNVDLDKVYNEISKELSIDENSFENDEALKKSYEAKLASISVDDPSKKETIAKIYAVSEVNKNSLNSQIQEINNDIESKKQETKEKIEDIKNDSTLSKLQKENKINALEADKNEFVANKNSLIDEKKKEINYYNKFNYFADSIVSGVNISKLAQANSYYLSKGETIRTNQSLYQDISLKNLYANYDRVISKNALLSVFDKEDLASIGDIDNLNTTDLKNGLDNSIGNRRWEANQPLNKEIIENEKQYNSIVNGNIAYIRALTQLNEPSSIVGKNIALSELDFLINGKEEKGLETYDNVIDLLTKRYGVDKIKLLEQIAKEKDKPENTEDSVLVDSILKKFGIDMEEIKIICAEKKIDLTIKGLFEEGSTLSNAEKERVEIVKEEEHLNEIEDKKETLTALIERAKTNGDFDSIKNFLNDEKNKDSLVTLNVDKDSILNFLNTEKFEGLSIEEKIGSFKNFEENIRIIDTMNAYFAHNKKIFDEKEEENLKAFVSTLPYQDRKMVEALSDYKNVEIKTDRLEKKINSILKLQKQGVYSDEKIDELLKAFAEGNLDALNEIVELEDTFNENDFTLISDLSLSKKDFKLKKIKEKVLSKKFHKIRLDAENKLEQAKKEAQKNTKTQKEKQEQESLKEKENNNRNKNLVENVGLLAGIFNKIINKTNKERERKQKIEEAKQKANEQGYQKEEVKTEEKEVETKADLVDEEGKVVETVDITEKE